MAKYLKRDTELGYIEDSAEIEKEKFNNLRHSIFGFMLGDFNEQGIYVIRDEIKNELIEMPKFWVDTIENIDICHSVLKLNRQISFMVTFESDCATLSLVEKINMEANFKLNSGTYSNVNEYMLDRIETSGKIDKTYIYKRWNISIDQGKVIDVFSASPEWLEKYFGIVNRFKYLLEANTILLEKEKELEEVEAEYTNNIFEILKHYPKLEKAVMQELKDNINEKKELLYLDKPNFVKTVNEILENVIDSNLTKLSKEEQQEFAVEKHNVVNESNIKKRSIIYIIETPTEAAELGLNKPTESEIITETLDETKTPKLSTSRQSNTTIELAQGFIRARSASYEKDAERAVDTLVEVETEKKGSKTTQLSRLVGTLVGVGVAVSSIASGPIVATVAGVVAGGVAERLVDAGESIVTQKKSTNNKNSGNATNKGSAPQTKTKGGSTSTKGGRQAGPGGGKQTSAKNTGTNQSNNESLMRRRRKMYGVYTPPAENNNEAGMPAGEENSENDISMDDLRRGVNNNAGTLESMIEQSAEQGVEQVIEEHTERVEELTDGLIS